MNIFWRQSEHEYSGKQSPSICLICFLLPILWYLGYFYLNSLQCNSFSKVGTYFICFSFSVSRSTMSITQGNKIMETLYLTGYFLTQNDLRRCHCSTSLCLSICPSLQYHNYLSLSTIIHLLDVKLPYDSVCPSIASLIGLLHGLSFIISYKFIHSSFLNYVKTDKIDRIYNPSTHSAFFL